MNVIKGILVLYRRTSRGVYSMHPRRTPFNNVAPPLDLVVSVTVHVIIKVSILFIPQAKLWLASSWLSDRKWKKKGLVWCHDVGKWIMIRT